MDTNAIKDFLDAFSDSITQENIDLYKKIIDKSEIKTFNNPEEFYFSVLYSWDKFISGFILTEISNNDDVKFIYKNYNFINRHFTEIFEKYEGSFACADKSRTIIRNLLDYFINNKNIEFNYDNEYTYHLPKNFLKTHDDIIEYYNSLKGLYYGRFENYFKSIGKILEIQDNLTKD